MWGFDNMNKSKLELKGGQMVTAHIYIWPEHGDVNYIADCIRIREATADTAVIKMELFVIFVDLSMFCPNIFCKIKKLKLK